MAWSVVQHSGAIHGQTVPGAITLGGAPTVGNLLIALVGCNIALSSITIGSGWTLFDRVGAPRGDRSANNVVMTAMYRYVQPGDTATLPAFWSAGTTYWSHEVWEVTSPSIVGTWDSDFLASVPLWNAPSNAALPQFPIFADGLALTGVASYNGSSNPSISGSWTLDDSNNNNSNFGSAAGAHRVVSNTNTIDGTWTQGTSAPFGGILILLTSTQPSGGVYPRHIFTTTTNAGGGDLPGSFTTPWTPKVGSLLLAYLMWEDGSVANPTIGTSWTEWTSETISVHKSAIACYRYVQIGDTSSLPTLVSSGTNAFWACTVIELDGGSGTFGTDHASDKVGGQASGATLTTTADTTTANNQFALLAFGNYDASSLSSQTGLTNYLNDSLDFSAYGGFFTAFEFYPTSGTTVQATITPGLTSNKQSYIQSVFNQGIGSHTWTASATEAASATDSESALVTHHDTITEAASAADSETAHKIASASITEAASAADACSTTGVIHVRSDSEAASAADTETAVIVEGGGNLFVISMG